jgi:hypothetical protein
LTTGNGDQVVCFSCDGGLKHWEVDDDPWVEHAKWFDRCCYLNMKKSKQFIDDVLRGITPGINHKKYRLFRRKLFGQKICEEKIFGQKLFGQKIFGQIFTLNYLTSLHPKTRDLN